MQMRQVLLSHANPLMSIRIHQAIALSPSSPLGHEAKRVALHAAGRYDDAIQTFETMLSKMAQSADPQIQGKLYPQFTIHLLKSFERAP